LSRPKLTRLAEPFEEEGMSHNMCFIYKLQCWRYNANKLGYDFIFPVFFPKFDFEIDIDIDIFVNCNWVVTRWQ